MDTKKCNKCKKDIDINLFGKNKTNKDRLDNRCKTCENERSRLKGNKNYKTVEGRIKALLYSYIQRDKKKNLVCDINLEFLTEICNKPCTYCGSNEKIGLDRLDNSQGHTMLNIVPCCSLCNIVRGNLLSFDEMKLLGPVLRNIQENRIINNQPILKSLFANLK